MQSKLQQTIHKLQPLHKYIHRSDVKIIYLLCGSEKGGKKTLVHYMNEAQLIFEVDQDGQDVLNIRQEMEKIVIVQQLLQLIPCVDKETLYIKLTGLPSSSKTAQELQEYSVVLDHLLHLFSLHVPCTLKLLLVFSLQQLQQDTQLLLKYHNSLSSLADFTQRTHIILTKLVDQDQFNQFIEITSSNIIQTHEQCAYVRNVIDEGRVFGFYSRDVDPDERYQFISNLEATTVSEDVKLVELGALTRKVLHEHSHQYHDRILAQLRQCLQLLNLTLQQTLYKSIKHDQPNLQTHQSQLYQKLYNKEILTKYNLALINDKKKHEEYISTFQNTFKIAKETPNLLLNTIMNKLLYFAQFLEIDAQEKDNFVGRLFVLVVVYNAVSEKGAFQFYKDADLVNVFTNHDQGVYDQHTLSKLYLKIKPLLTPQFAKTYQKLATSSPTKKKQKKAPSTPSLPDYDEQKKQYLSKPKKLSQIQQLLPSPLKIDLLFQELQKLRKNGKRNTSQEKKVIKDICYLLGLYQCYEEIVKIKSVLPDLYGMVVGLKGMIKGGKVEGSVAGFVKGCCEFFMELNRPQYTQQIIQHLQTITPPPSQLIKQLQQLQTGTPTSAPSPNTFLNYSRMEQLLKSNSRRQKLIEKCLQYEGKAGGLERIQRQIVKKWVYSTPEVKIF